MGCAFGGPAGGLAVHDLPGGLGHKVLGGEVGDGRGADVPPIVAARAGGEGAAGDAEIQHLVEVAHGHREAGADLRESGGERGLGGEGEVHVAGFLEEPIEKALGGRVVELGPVVSADGPVSGDWRVLPLIARGSEGADHGRHGVGKAAVGHGFLWVGGGRGVYGSVRG